MIGELVNLTCSFQDLLDADKMTVTRGDTREHVITTYRNGTIKQSLGHANATFNSWTSDAGSVMITIAVHCGDETNYYCDVAGSEAVSHLSVLSKYNLKCK